MLDFDTCLGPAGGGELRLRRLHEADALKVSKGCTLPKSVAWKNSTLTQGGDRELFSTQRKLCFQLFVPNAGRRNKATTMNATGGTRFIPSSCLSMKQTQTNSLTICNTHEKKTGKIQALPHQ